MLTIISLLVACQNPQVSDEQSARLDDLENQMAAQQAQLDDADARIEELESSPVMHYAEVEVTCTEGGVFTVPVAGTVAVIATKGPFDTEFGAWDLATPEDGQVRVGVCQDDLAAFSYRMIWWE